MRIAIHQPDYFPYLGYFYKISKADLFVYLDDAQFSNDNMHHRNNIKTSQGTKRITIPLDYHFKDAINEVRTKDELGWKKKHLDLLTANYSNARYYKEIFPVVKELLLTKYENLADMNMTINRFILAGFGLRTAIVKASELNVDSKKEQRILDICTILRANEYYSGLGARAYQAKEDFLDRGIALTYTDYKPFKYPQQGEGFEGNLSVLDFLFNCGFDWNRVLEGVRKGEGQ
ncbi:WbqC-like protein family protein [Anaerocolumna jejuensis DSM 15929]|uniref:WbqC-like protein family protein n=1 Tax=Anaerocolumna jejuensis DSM 15929 TaxID=1121322 RepID=A0A1M6JQJ0_9FIRM|nr:WbqC family protein [Anaerocolumna jejuensis]SHJ49035.1 WbqC-like protein family protein [Anaerocolumna jejuensis DSM 15929]